MKDYVTPSERAEIYETAWRAYATTQSSDYAYRRAANVGDRLGIMPVRADGIARDAIEKIQDLLRQRAGELVKETPERVKQYLKQFPNTPYSRGEGVGEIVGDSDCAKTRTRF